MSLISIFSLFGEENNPENRKLEEELKEYKETPHFKLGMFNKLIINGVFFKRQILSFFSKSDPKLDIEEIDTAGEYMMYTRAYFWIEGCNLRSKTWREALKVYSEEEFLCSIKLCMNYFEGIEEYEKCAHLKKIQDFIKKNLPK